MTSNEANKINRSCSVSQQPLISMRSTTNNQHLYKKPVDYPDPVQFAQLMSNIKKSETLFKNRRQFKETFNNFLIPETSNIRKEIDKPQSRSRSQTKAKYSSAVYQSQNKLDALDGEKKIELVNYFHDQLKHLKLQRREVVRTKFNQARSKPLPYKELKLKSPRC